MEIHLRLEFCEVFVVCVPIDDAKLVSVKETGADADGLQERGVFTQKK